jgi:hypothetical protein
MHAYNFDSTFDVLELDFADSSRWMAMIVAFMKAVKRELSLPEGEDLHFFFFPKEPLFAEDRLPFEAPVKGNEYRTDIVKCILWVSKGECLIVHFPYSITISRTSISFDGGEPESPESAANIIREVLLENNYDNVNAMSPGLDLVSRYVVPLLSTAQHRVY